MPNLIKIGMTTNAPDERMQQLFGTGVPEQFVLEYCAIVPSGAKAESRAHQALSDYRYKPNREFFKILVLDAVSLITQTIGPHTVHTDRQNAIRVAALKKAREEERAEARVLETRKHEFLVKQAAKKKIEDEIFALQLKLGGTRKRIEDAECKLDSLKASYKKLCVRPTPERQSFWTSYQRRSQYEKSFEDFIKPWTSLEAEMKEAEETIQIMRCTLSEDEIKTAIEVQKLMQAIRRLD